MRNWQFVLFCWALGLVAVTQTAAQAPISTGHPRFDSLVNAAVCLQFPQDVLEMRVHSEITIREAHKLNLTNELIRLYAERGKMYLDDAPLLDSCLWFLKKAESLLPRTDFPEGELLTYLYQGWYYSVVSDSLQAMHYLDRATVAMGLMDAHKTDSSVARVLSRAYLSMGSIYQAMNHYERAMHCYLYGLPLAQICSSTIVTAHYHVQIGELYRLLYQPDQAKQEFEKVILLTEDGTLPKHRAWAHEQLGELELVEGRILSAKVHFQEALRCRKSIGLVPDPAYLQLGRWYAQKGWADSAEAYLQQVDTSQLHYRFKTQYYIAWAQTHLAYGNLPQAKAYAQQGEAYACQQLNKSLLQQALAVLVEVMDAQRDWQAAYEYRTELSKWEIRLRDETQQRTIAEMEGKFDAERREQQIAALGQENAIKDLTLQQQRYQLWGLVVAIPLLVGSGLLVNQRRQYRAKRRELDLEQTLLRTQMNPHFIFNALASIQHAVLNQETQKATLYLAQFGELTRSILESSRKPTISLSEELEMAQNYFALEQIRFNKALTLTLHTSGVTTKGIQVPAMILQPLLENAVKHAFAGREAGEISITLSVDQQTLLLTITDDGVGLSSAPTQAHKSTSLGLKILEERLRQHWPKPPAQPLRIQNREPSGVSVTLLLPLHSHA
ncbi:MAG: histidine kinase [Bacteroidota bacterium]